MLSSLDYATHPIARQLKLRLSEPQRSKCRLSRVISQSSTPLVTQSRHWAMSLALAAALTAQLRRFLQTGHLQNTHPRSLLRVALCHSPATRSPRCPVRGGQTPTPLPSLRFTRARIHMQHTSVINVPPISLDLLVHLHRLRMLHLNTGCPHLAPLLPISLH